MAKSYTLDTNLRTFGVEVEFGAICRRDAIIAVACALHKQPSDVVYFGGTYDSWLCTDTDGRKWLIQRDSSVNAMGGESCELVTPILQGDEDIATLQHIIRALRRDGARVHRSCGLHVHVGALDFKPYQLRNLQNLWFQNEALFYKAFQVDEHHRNVNYCAMTDRAFFYCVNKIPKRNLTHSAFFSSWYHCTPEDVSLHASRHYDDSRYRGLNFHSTAMRGTIEFRLFNSTLHAGKVKAYIQLCLALVDKAFRAGSCRKVPRQMDNPAFAMHTLLNDIGIIGDDKFSTCKLVCFEHLEGNIAHRYGAPTKRRALRGS